MNTKCNICGDEVDFDNGGAALMMAFCYDHSVSLNNVSYCADCYKMFVDGPLRILSGKARLEIPSKEATE